MKEISLAIFFCSVATSPAAPGANGQESPKTHPAPATASTIDPARTCAYWKEKLITGVCAGYAFVNESVAHLSQCPPSEKQCDRATCCPHTSCTGHLCVIPHMGVISLQAIRPNAHTIECPEHGCDYDTCCMPTCVGFTSCSAEKNEVLIPHPHRVVCGSGGSSSDGGGGGGSSSSGSSGGGGSSSSSSSSSSGGSKVSSKSSPCTVEQCCESTCGALYDSCPHNFKPSPLFRLARCPSPYGCNPRGGGKARVSHHHHHHHRDHDHDHEEASKQKDDAGDVKRKISEAEKRDIYKVIDHCCAPTCGHTGGGGDAGGDTYKCKAEGTTLLPHADYIRCDSSSTRNSTKSSSNNACNDDTCCYEKTLKKAGDEDSSDKSNEGTELERNNLHLSGRNYRLTFIPPDGQAASQGGVDLFSTALKKVMCEQLEVNDKQITLNTTWVVQEDNASDESLTISSIPHLEVSYKITSLTASKRHRIISLVGSEPFWVFLNARAGHKVWESGPYWECAWRFYHLNVKDPQRPHKEGLLQGGRSTSSDSDTSLNNKGSSANIYLIIGVGILGLLCVLLTVTCCACLRRYRRLGGNDNLRPRMTSTILTREDMKLKQTKPNPLPASGRRSTAPDLEAQAKRSSKETSIMTREELEQEKTKPNPLPALKRRSTGPDLEAQAKRSSEKSTNSQIPRVTKSPIDISNSSTIDDLRDRKGSAKITSENYDADV